jgi:hypothetical protein
LCDPLLCKICFPLATQLILASQALLSHLQITTLHT